MIVEGLPEGMVSFNDVLNVVRPLRLPRTALGAPAKEAKVLRDTLEENGLQHAFVVYVLPSWAPQDYVWVWQEKDELPSG